MPGTETETDWRLFFGNGERNEEGTKQLEKLEPPPWRHFDNKADIFLDAEGIDPRWQELQQRTKPKDIRRGQNFRISPEAKDVSML